MKLIIAGKYYECEQLVKREGWSAHEWIYARTVDVFAGLDQVEIHWCGTWHLRSDAEDVSRAVAGLRSSGAIRSETYHR